MIKTIWQSKGYSPLHERVLETFFEFARQDGQTYYLLPNIHLVGEAEKRLLAEKSVLCGGRISIVADFISAMIAASGSAKRVLERNELALIMGDLLSKDDVLQKLTYLNRVDDLSDMGLELYIICSQWRLHEYCPQFVDPKMEQDLTLLSDLFYQSLEQRKVLDEPLALELAISCCAEATFDFGGNLLVLGGLEFSELFVRLVNSLASRFQELIVVDPASPNPVAWGRDWQIVHLNTESDTLASLLFQETKKSATEPYVQINQYFDQHQEVKEVLRTIKDLVLRHDASLSQMAIVIVNPADYRDHLSHLATRSGIPLTGLGNSRLLQTLPARYLLSLLNLANSNWSSSALLEFLSGDWIWPANFDAQLLAQFIRVVPENGPLADWIATCRNQRNYYQWQKNRTLPIDESTLFNVEKFEIINHSLQFLWDIWQKIMIKKGSIQDWIRVIEALSTTFNFEETLSSIINVLPENEAISSYRAWVMLKNYLIQQNSEGEFWPQSMTLSEFYNLLSMVWKTLVVPESNPLSDSVHVLTPVQIAGLSFDYVFVLGLNEDTWQNTAHLGWLGHPTDELITSDFESEKIIFQRLVATATQRLYLSSWLKDLKGLELIEHDFISQVKVKSAHKRIIKPTAIWACNPLNALNNAEALALWSYQRMSPALTAEINKRVAIEEGRALGELNSYNGVMGDQKIIEALKNRYQDTVYSTSRLEQYAQCPWLFFGQRVLGLSATEELSTGITPLHRGNIIHHILARFLQNYIGETLTYTHRTTYMAELNRYLLAEISDLKASLSSSGALWVELEYEYIRIMLRLWLDHEIDLQSNTMYRPNALEYDFSDDRSLLLENETSTMWISGFIDRVDVSADGLLIYDYKTGQVSTLADIKNGLAFQIPFYLLAAALRFPEKKVVGGGYYQIGSDFKRTRGMWHTDYLGDVNLSNRISDQVAAADWEPLFESSKNFAFTYRDRITAGVFPVQPTKECSDYCIFKRICRFKPQS